MLSGRSYVARVGLLVAMSVATVGCGRQAAFGNGHIEVADAVAEAAIRSELGRLQQLAASEDDLSDMDEELGTVMTDLESPTGVAEVRAVERHAGGLDIDSHGERRVLVARPMVVTPDDGEPFCVVVGLDSDGRAAGSPADGDAADDCRDAVIPTQESHEGNPLELWAQNPRWFDPLDPPPPR